MKLSKGTHEWQFKMSFFTPTISAWVDYYLFFKPSSMLRLRYWKVYSRDQNSLITWLDKWFKTLPLLVTSAQLNLFFSLIVKYRKFLVKNIRIPLDIQNWVWKFENKSYELNYFHHEINLNATNHLINL